jgi:serine/threonine protein kinase/Tfp pilus assembly protein PilF
MMPVNFYECRDALVEDGENPVISETISHYRILKKLGEGGMGEVYLAEDTRLGRQVALKFLPASYQYDPDRRARFLKEARAASALRTPNIAAIYDIGEHDQIMFIVMEYVEGELLSRRVERGSMDALEALGIATQIADALDEAHTLGIIHRDIKGSNLMITARGLVKMLDFGLAKVMESRSTSDSSDFTVPLGQQTAAGIVLGTISYMSPEQALGRDVDHRTDLFSLGVVIYEMLTSRLPFGGKSATETIDNIVHQDPLPVSRFNNSVPGELERIARKCLEKDRERRYQSAREVATDLRNLRRDLDSGTLSTSSLTGSSTGSVPGARRSRSRSRKTIDSLAILPLANAGDDPDTEYLSDGITESIINNLSQLPKLRVMARSTVFRYKGKEVDPKEAGNDLGVRAVLAGRMFQRGDALIIKVELVDTSDGSHLWGEQYNRKLADIFSIEEEISSVISEKLRLKLDSTQKKKLARRHTENTEAYQLYLKGRYYWNKRTADGIKKGIEYFNQAIDSDPNYALAYAGIADSYNILASYSTIAPKDAFPRSKAAAKTALELDDKLAEGYASLAFATFGYDWNWAEAERAFKRAIELNPGYGSAHQWYGLYLAAMDRMGEAFAEVKIAEELDPLSLPVNTNAGWLLYLTRRYDEAIETYNKILELDADFILAHRRLGQVYVEKRMHEEAIREFDKCLAPSREDAESLAWLGHAYAASGDGDRARQVIDEMNLLGKSRYVSSYLMAIIRIGLGELDLAFELLEKACDERYGFLAYLKVSPIFDPLREDARFQELVARVGLAA